MDLLAYLKDSSESDPTWEEANNYIRESVRIPTNLVRLIKGGWNGQLELTEFLHLIGHCRINVGCLLEAAQIKSDGRRPDMTYVTRALQSLGLMYSSVVVAINVATRLALKSKPPALWKAYFKEMMSAVEVGYKFGSKVAEISPAGGALIGFAEYLGPTIFMISKPKEFKEWRLQFKKHGRVGRKLEINLFGCEAYQVAGLALQQFGFGIEIAVGAAVGVGELNPQHVILDRKIVRWKAAQKWIEALRLGRDMPADPRIRELFPEIAPAKNRSEKNLSLSVLYTEVAKVKSDGSDWTWHLPYPSYEKTEEEWRLER